MHRVLKRHLVKFCFQGCDFDCELFFLGTENRDSGVADVEVCACTQNMTLRSPEQTSIEDPAHEGQFKRSALSNSLLDIHEQCEYFVN